MQYIVGINQNIILYKAIFSSRYRALLCSSKIQKTEKGILHQMKKPKYLGAYFPSFLFVAELISSSFSYLTALSLEIKYGEKIIAANSNRNPAGIMSISNCAIKTIILVTIKNTRFQKLSLLSLALIKLRIRTSLLCSYFCYKYNMNLSLLVDFYTEARMVQVRGWEIIHQILGQSDYYKRLGC